MNLDDYIEGIYNPMNPVNCDEKTNICNYCGEECENEFCDNKCKKLYEND